MSFSRSGLTVNWSSQYAQHSGVRGGLRCADAILVPERCLPHMRHPGDRGLDGLYTQPPLELPPEGTVLICVAEPGDGVVLDL